VNFLFWVSQERPPHRLPRRLLLLILGLLAAFAVVLVGRTWVGGEKIDPAGSPFLAYHDLGVTPFRPDRTPDRSPAARAAAAGRGPDILRTIW